MQLAYIAARRDARSSDAAFVAADAEMSERRVEMIRRISFIRAVALPLALALWPSVLRGQGAAAPQAEILRERLQAMAAEFPGKAGIFVRNVETGAEVAIHADDLFPMASTYKVAIMTQVFREVDAGRISLDERVTLGESDRRAGSGLFVFMKPGLSPTIHDLLLLMITVSDNEATDLLLKRVGAGNVTAMLRQIGIRDFRVDRSTEQIIGDWLGAADPKLRGISAAQMLAKPEQFGSLTREQLDAAARAFADDPRDHTSPKAMAELLTKIVKNEAASEKSCQDMLGIMTEQQLRGRIPRYLEELTTATKSGTIGPVTNDVGVINVGKQHIVVSVYTLKENSSVETELAEEFIARVALVAYDYFQDIASVH
jgi:beta-lactamase class A